MSMLQTICNLGARLTALADDQAEWSQATFGTDQQRGPIGALKHLVLEAREALAAPRDIIEYADILLLLLDASRRAGFSPGDLIDAAQCKMLVNKSRQWPTSLPSDEPTQHVRAGSHLEPAGVVVSGGYPQHVPYAVYEDGRA